MSNKHRHLYHGRTGNSLRAAIAVELSGASFERHFVNLPGGENRKECFLEINPAGNVPVLVDTDDTQGKSITLTQSGAILDYLLSKYRPDLIPENLAEHAVVNSCVLAALSDIAVTNGFMRYMTFHSENEPFLRERLIRSLTAAFHPVRNSPYLGGDRPNIADFAHFPVVYMREELIRSIETMRPVIDWLMRMKKIDAVDTAIAYAGVQVPFPS